MSSWRGRPRLASRTEGRGWIMEQMSAIRDWGGRFVVPVPRAEVC